MISEKILGMSVKFIIISTGITGISEIILTMKVIDISEKDTVFCEIIGNFEKIYVISDKVIDIRHDQ